MNAPHPMQRLQTSHTQRVGYGEVIFSANEQAEQVHVSTFTPRSPIMGSATDAVRRMAGSPQALQVFPGARFGVASSAARRFSRSWMREGASVILFQSGHLSSSARMSERTANGIS